MNVMSRAWTIAKEGQKKFGGSVKEYFAQALKMAWAAKKSAPVKAVIELSVSRKAKTWVARILGPDKTFGFEREFLSADYKEDSEHGYRLLDGIYEICETGKRYFIAVVNGKYSRIEKDEIVKSVA